MMKRLLMTLSIAVSLLVFCAATASAQWCDADEVSAEVIGNDITVYHDNAAWNCCVQIQFDLVENGNVLDLYETEVGWPCFCICCFDLIAVINDVAPGDYLIRVLDAASGNVLGQTEVTVAGGDAAKAGLGETLMSPCGGWLSGIPDITPDEATSWGAIKTLYR